MTVEIFTDGACSGNPGPGGWGAILRYGDAEKELSGGEAETTNNRMELMACIAALEALTRPTEVTLTSDSKYVLDGIKSWMPNWKRNGWKTAAKKPVKNVDLWQRLDAATAGHTISWKWIKGHAGHAENERADELARGHVCAGHGRAAGEARAPRAARGRRGVRRGGHEDEEDIEWVDAGVGIRQKMRDLSLFRSLALSRI